jgi:hypothetical protein
LRINEYLTSILFSTLNVVYEQIVTSIFDSAQDHIKLADELNSQVVEVLKGAERKNEETKKKVSLAAIFTSFNLNTYFCHGSKELQYFQKLLADRDRFYTDRLKVGDCYSMIPRPI